jgi:LysM repeat protein
MGLFDKMFGRGASEAQQQGGAQERFNSLKQKYQPVLNLIEQEQIQLLNLHVQDNKLFIKGIAPSEEAKNKVWDQVKLVDPNWENDIILDLSVRESQAQSAAAGGGSGRTMQTYTVKPGDTLSKISQQFYGDADEYMRIFYANKDSLKDPDHIRAGQQLSIPQESNS